MFPGIFFVQLCRFAELFHVNYPRMQAGHRAALSTSVTEPAPLHIRSEQPY